MSVTEGTGLTVLLVGAGRMGGALARAWKVEHRVLVHDPHAPAIPGTERLEALASVTADVVVLAVKPQLAGGVLPAVGTMLGDATLLSITAGLGIAALRNGLGGAAAVVRAMPNTPAAIGAGVTGLYAPSEVGSARRAAAERLMASTGRALWFKRETDLDIVTAVSGSGPAYFFRFAEALAAAGEAAGLDAADAMTLARATLEGAGALAAAEAGRPLADLRAAVTSPGGTTAAGLAAMEAAGIAELAVETVRAARDRAVELGQ